MSNSHLREPLLKRDKRCRACFEDRPWKLIVHHLTYARVGHEELSDVVLLCGDCHNRLHSICKGSDPDLANFTKRFIQAKGMMWGKQKKRRKNRYGKQKHQDQRRQEYLAREILLHI